MVCNDLQRKRGLSRWRPGESDSVPISSDGHIPRNPAAYIIRRDDFACRLCQADDKLREGVKGKQGQKELVVSCVMSEMDWTHFLTKVEECTIIPYSFSSEGAESDGGWTREEMQECNRTNPIHIRPDNYLLLCRPHHDMFQLQPSMEILIHPEIRYMEEIMIMEEDREIERALSWKLAGLDLRDFLWKDYIPSSLVSLGKAGEAPFSVVQRSEAPFGPHHSGQCFLPINPLFVALKYHYYTNRYRTLTRAAWIYNTQEWKPNVREGLRDASMMSLHLNSIQQHRSWHLFTERESLESLLEFWEKDIFKAWKSNRVSRHST